MLETLNEASNLKSEITELRVKVKELQEEKAILKAELLYVVKLMELK